MDGIVGLHHVAITVTDLVLAERFYVELLGGEMISRFEWDQSTTLPDKVMGLRGSIGRQFIVRVGGLYIEVFQFDSPRVPENTAIPPFHHPGYSHFCLQVDDIDVIHARLTAAGLSFISAPQHSGEPDLDGRKQGFRACYGQDFLGNVFELIEIADNSVIRPIGWTAAGATEP